MKWFNGITIYLMIGLIIRWFQKATEDGQVTVAECVELLIEAGKLIGITIPHEILLLCEKEPDDKINEHKEGTEV